MRCLETRQTPEGFRRRRYDNNGLRFSTIEVPIEVWRGINGQGSARNRAEANARAKARESIRAHALRLSMEGWRTIAIASELQMPLRSVQRWITEGQKR